MRSRNVVFFLALVLCGPIVVAQGNPGVFQYYVAPVSSRLAFFASQQGGQVLLHSPAPNARALLSRFHPELLASYPQSPVLKSPSGRTAVPLALVGCGTTSGTQMNFEGAANALPQNSESIDHIRNFFPTGTGNLDLVVETANDARGLAGPGNAGSIFVHRDPNAACYAGPPASPANTDFEMGNPTITSPLLSTDIARSMGLSRVLADPANGQFIIADLRLGNQVAGVGLRRIPTAELTNTTNCPPGTLSLAQSTICATTGGAAVIVSATDDENVDFPGLAQDQRASGVGAGDIYVSNTALDAIGYTTEIHLTACTKAFATLANCSPTKTISSAADTGAQFSSVSVVPPGGPNAGTITVVYGAFGYNPSTGMPNVAIRLVKCTPKGAPVAPTCGSPIAVVTEANPLTVGRTFGFAGQLMGNAGLNVNTIPTHANRADSTTGQTTFVVWTRCKANVIVIPGSACPDADISMRTSTDLGTTWAAVTALDATSSAHEFDPAITVDNGQNITDVAYYHTPDTVRFKNRTVVDMKQIPNASTTPGAVVAITSTADSPEGDANFTTFGFGAGLGDFLGISSHGAAGVGTSCAYVGHTNNVRLGTYGGLSNAESNNHVSKFCY